MVAKRIRNAFLACCFVSLACGDIPSSESSSTTESESGAEPSAAEQALEELSGCELPQPCAVLTPPDLAVPGLLDWSDDLACIVELMLSSEPGLIEFQVSNGIEEASGHSVTIFMRDEQQAMACLQYYWFPTSETYGEPQFFACDVSEELQACADAHAVGESDTACNKTLELFVDNVGALELSCPPW